MFYLVTFLFAASLFAPALTRRFKRNALLILALPLLVTFIWTATQYKQAFSETPLQQSYIWVNNLDLSLTFQLDGLSWLMSLIVTGVGALVMIYASRYFPENAAGLPLFTACFFCFRSRHVRAGNRQPLDDGVSILGTDDNPIIPLNRPSL